MLFYPYHHPMNHELQSHLWQFKCSIRWIWHAIHQTYTKIKTTGEVGRYVGSSPALQTDAYIIYPITPPPPSKIKETKLIHSCVLSSPLHLLASSLFESQDSSSDRAEEPALKRDPGSPRSTRQLIIFLFFFLAPLLILLLKAKQINRFPPNHRPRQHFFPIAIVNTTSHLLLHGKLNPIFLRDLLCTFGRDYLSVVGLEG